MSKTKIKICGLSRIQDIEYVNKALPDYIGFVFTKSIRQIRFQTALALKSQLDSRIKAVGVFVNENIKVISDLCTLGIIDYVQLHGEESAEYVRALKNRIDNPIIKAIRVKDSSTIKTAEQFPCDFLLLDTYTGKEYGGTGKTFDWGLINGVSKPFFLAGGICLENAAQAIKQASPYCLDVSSGVETNSLKNRDKIIQLVNKIRSDM